MTSYKETEYNMIIDKNTSYKKTEYNMIVITMLC